MTIARRVFGILLWGFCLWLVISSLKPLMFQIRQTGDWEAALYDPVYYLPLAGAGLGVLGGLVILAGAPGGAVLGLLGAVIYFIYPTGILMHGFGQEMWFSKYVNAGIESVLALGALRLPRHPDG